MAAADLDRYASDGVTMMRAGTSAGPVLVHRTTARRLVNALLQAMPPSLRKLWRGPVQAISLAEGASGKVGAWSIRPVDVVVSPEVVLQQRLTIPSGARKDLASAVELFVAHKTPFAPNELLIHAAEGARRPGDAHASYVVRAVPRTMVEAGLKDRKIRLGRVVRIGIDGLPDVDFAPALRRAGFLQRWWSAMPVAITLISLAVLATGELSARNERLASLGAEASEALVRVRTLNTELEAQGRQRTGLGEVTRLLDATPSAYLTLAAIREQLPETAEIAKIELRGGEARLTIRAPNVLATVQALNANPEARWTASVDGPITADAASMREAATILLRGLDA